MRLRPMACGTRHGEQRPHFESGPTVMGINPTSVITAGATAATSVVVVNAAMIRR
jgi:hypothetical protein